MMRIVLMLAALMGLSACGELDQSLTADRAKSGDQPWQGAKNSYVAKDWTPSDQAGWETQLRKRAQSQNEYTKTN